MNYIDKPRGQLKYEDFYHGQRFWCVWNGIHIAGTITIESGYIYLCQDLMDGANCMEKHGHKYSYQLVGKSGEGVYITSSMADFKLESPNLDYMGKMQSELIYEDFYHGQRFMCAIDEGAGNWRFATGKVTIEGDKIYLCQNEVPGSDCTEKHGHQYSYVISSYPGSVTIDGSSDGISVRNLLIEKPAGFPNTNWNIAGEPSVVGIIPLDLTIDDLVPGQFYHIEFSSDEGDPQTARHLVFQYKENSGDKDRPVAHAYAWHEPFRPEYKKYAAGDAATPWITGRKCRAATKEEADWLTRCMLEKKALPYITENDTTMGAKKDASRKNTKLYKLGDKVRIKKDTEYYKAGDSFNPIDMDGTVSISDDDATAGYFYRVKWANGHSNSYRDEDLQLVSKFNDGDKVRIKKESEHYTGEKNNPKDTTGTCSIRPTAEIEDAYIYRVDWDNGETYVYREDDLVKWEEAEPSDGWKAVAGTHLPSATTRDKKKPYVKTIVWEEPLGGLLKEQKKYVNVSGLEDPADDRLMGDFADIFTFIGFSRINSGAVFRYENPVDPKAGDGQRALEDASDKIAGFGGILTVFGEEELPDHIAPTIFGTGGEMRFDVRLMETGGNKLGVVKAIKDFTGIGLKDAKDIADNAPITVKEDMSEEEAMALKKELEDAGAMVEIR
jgi:hypothetical protein